MRLTHQWQGRLPVDRLGRCADLFAIAVDDDLKSE